MSAKNHKVSEWTTPEGIKMLKVTGDLTTQKDRHALNRVANTLAPSRYKVKWGQLFIIDLRRVEQIGELGFRALKHTTNLFVMCGGRVCMCTDSTLTENPLWAAHINSRVSVRASYQEAVGSFNMETVKPT